MYYSKAIFLSALLITLFGCGSEKQNSTEEVKKQITKPVDPTIKIQNEVKKLQEYAEENFKSRFKDPDSMKIKNRLLSTQVEEVVDIENTNKKGGLFYYCFTYNAKNGMGAYTGYETVKVFLIYTKDDLYSEINEEILNWSLDNSYFPMRSINSMTGNQTDKGCDIEKPSAEVEPLAKELFKLFS